MSDSKNASDAITMTINDRPVSTAFMHAVRNPVFSLSEGTFEIHLSTRAGERSPGQSSAFVIYLPCYIWDCYNFD